MQLSMPILSQMPKGYGEEVMQLRRELDEARGDLADQQDAIGNLTQERDESRVEVRRLEYLLQLVES